MTNPDMIGVRSAAEIANVSPRRILQLLRDRRIPGAKKVSGVWLIPADFTVTRADRHRPGKINFR